jgi:hypothetical protein
VQHEAKPGEIQAEDGQRSYRQAGANCLGKRTLVMGEVRVPIAEKKAVEESVVPLCQDNKYTICAAEDDDASPSRRPFIKFHLRKNATSQTPTITALYDTGAAVSLITPGTLRRSTAAELSLGRSQK